MKEITVTPDAVEEIPLTRHYTDQEKSDMALQASKLNEEVSDLKDQKSDAVAGFNSAIKEKESARNLLTGKVRKGFEQYSESCNGYLENSQGRWYMVFYDSTGQEVSRRLAKPSERQYEINMGKDGTNG